MALIEWSEELSVGFGEVDQDHRKLVEIVNSLAEAVSGEPAPAQVARVFAELLSYTQWHFRHEERLMQTHGYLGFFDHKAEHDRLLTQAAALNGKFQSGDTSVPEKLLPFLRDWLAEHILGADLKMGRYLAAKVG